MVQFHVQCFITRRGVWDDIGSPMAREQAERLLGQLRASSSETHFRMVWRRVS